MSECGLCNEFYGEKEHFPVILECMHTFCNTCLTEWSENDVIECPMCRKTTNVSPNNLNKLKNFALLDMISEHTEKMSKLKTQITSGNVEELQEENEVQKEKQLETDIEFGAAKVEEKTDNAIEYAKCDLCEEIHEAVFVCLDCNERMCAFVAKLHKKSKGTQNHTVLPLEKSHVSEQSHSDNYKLSKRHFRKGSESIFHRCKKTVSTIAIASLAAAATFFVYKKSTSSSSDVKREEKKRRRRRSLLRRKRSENL